MRADGSIPVGVVGAAGRMGKLLAQEVMGADGLRLAAASERASHPDLGRDVAELLGRPGCGVSLTADSNALVQTAKVLIDFTIPELTCELATLAAKAGCNLVIGTTGLNEAQRELIERAAKSIAIVWAPNMSVGVNVLFGLAAQAAERLGLAYDIEVVEAHHRHKKDAPSGTAMRLVEVLAEATAKAGTLSERLKHGRQGIDPRQDNQIGVHAVRGGDIVGDHTVTFATEGERVELTHRASSRQTFTRGAIRAVHWVAEQPPGLYDMQDVLGLH